MALLPGYVYQLLIGYYFARALLISHGMWMRRNLKGTNIQIYGTANTAAKLSTLFSQANASVTRQLNEREELSNNASSDATPDIVLLFCSINLYR